MREVTVTAACTCGATSVEASGKPIVTAICYCDDCQEAARRFAPSLARSDGGTEAVLFRKDRVRWRRGEASTRIEKLKPDSPTNRVLATHVSRARRLTFSF